jgi:hypothetical protein
MDIDYRCEACGQDLTTWVRSAKGPYFCPGCRTLLALPDVQTARKSVRSRDVFLVLLALWLLGLGLCWWMGWYGAFACVFFSLLPLALLFFLFRPSS